MNPRDVVDDLLEISVIGSYSRIGPAIRRRLFGWRPPPAGAFTGRTVAVTGPTSGLGLESATTFAALGARVVLIGRDAGRLDRLADELAAMHGEHRFPVVVADLGSLAAARAAAARIVATEERLDVLVDNAGAMFPDRTDTADGIEASLAVLAVGPFVLTAGLLPLLRATRAARVIAVTSGGMYAQRLDLDDLQSRRGPYSGPRAYARAKRAQVVLVREWSRRLAGSGITFSAMHPGWVDTPGIAASLPGFHGLMQPLLRNPADGVDTIVWLATKPDPNETDGRLHLDRRVRPFDRLPATRQTPAERRRLWELVVGLAGGLDPAL